MDDPTPRIAARLKEERQRRAWTLDDLAAHTGVSKAMLSKLERGEASPTAALLGRISGALGLTMGSLLGEVQPPQPRLLRAGEQPVWKDPSTGYLRRQLTPLSGRPGIQLVEVSLPPRARVDFPASAYAFIRQAIWVLDGRLRFQEGDQTHELEAGDCLELGPPADCSFINPGRSACRYLVAVAAAV